MDYPRVRWPIFLPAAEPSATHCKIISKRCPIFHPCFAVISNQQITTTAPRFTIIYTTICNQTLRNPSKSHYPPQAKIRSPKAAQTEAGPKQVPRKYPADASKPESGWISHHANFGDARLLTTLDSNACPNFRRARVFDKMCNFPPRATRPASYAPCRTNPTQTHAQNIPGSLPSDAPQTVCS